MNRPQSRCYFCELRPSVTPATLVQVCQACAERIGGLATDNPVLVWSVSWPPMPIPATYDALVSQLREMMSNDVGEPSSPVAREISLAEAARASRDAGSHAMAVKEAGFAIRAGKDLVASLELLLSPPLLKPKGLAVLKHILQRA